MTKGKEKHTLSLRLTHALSNEHAGLVDLIGELEVYVLANPDDNWAVGQLRWSKKRVAQLEQKLGLAKNRRAR
jgi:hypothetical protein